jgi:tRNA (cmo5U34)-methyltransferase
MKEHSMSRADTPFNQAHAQTYAAGPPRLVPGFDGLQRMMSMLLAETVPTRGEVLVLGAGGGLELNTLAGDHPNWTFDGVDPSGDMLDAAKHTAGRHLDRIRLHQGYVETAPEGPFDAAVCLFTFHFIARAQRLPTLLHLRRRLNSGAPLVLAHISMPEQTRSTWIARHVAYAQTDPSKVEQARHALATRLTILAPEEEEAMMQEAGFSEVSLFYAALGFRGWITYAGQSGPRSE